MTPLQRRLDDFRFANYFLGVLPLPSSSSFFLFLLPLPSSSFFFFLPFSFSFSFSSSFSFFFFLPFSFSFSFSFSFFFFFFFFFFFLTKGLKFSSRKCPLVDLFTCHNGQIDNGRSKSSAGDSAITSAWETPFRGRERTLLSSSSQIPKKTNVQGLRMSRRTVRAT